MASAASPGPPGPLCPKFPHHPLQNKGARFPTRPFQQRDPKTQKGAKGGTTERLRFGSGQGVDRCGVAVLPLLLAELLPSS